MFDITVWVGAVLMGTSLGLLGSGGSILTVPILVYLAKESEKVAIAESLLIVGVVALVGSVTHILQRSISLRETIAFGIPSMLAAFFGAYLAQFVSGQTQLIVFSIVMLAASVFMLRPISTVDVGPKNDVSHRLTLALSGCAVGTLAGFVGVGGGFLIVPALLMFARLPMKTAVATSLIIIAMQSLSGFAQYAVHFNSNKISFNWELVLLVTTCAVLGVVAGIFVSKRFQQKLLRKLFGLSLIPMSIFILSTNF